MRKLKPLAAALVCALILTGCAGGGARDESEPFGEASSGNGAVDVSAESSVPDVSGENGGDVGVYISTLPESAEPFHPQTDEAAFIIGENQNIVSPELTPEYERDESAFEIKNGVITGYTGSAKKIVVPAIIGGKAARAVEASLFKLNTRLEAVYIEDGIETLGVFCFEGCVNLASVRLPETLTDIGWGAFRDCPRIEEIYLPDNLVRMTNVFENDVGLRTVRLPRGVDAYLQEFVGCSSLSGDAYAPPLSDDFNYGMYYGMYADCAGIERLFILDGAKKILRGAFDGMSALKELHLPETVTKIEGEIDELFKGCSSLEKIYVVEGSYTEYLFSASKWADMLCSEEAAR